MKLPLEPVVYWALCGRLSGTISFCGLSAKEIAETTLYGFGTKQILQLSMDHQ